jgi:hypothetical protein
MEGNIGAPLPKGSKGSFSSSYSSGRKDARRELGVPDRDKRVGSATSGAAIARFDVTREVPWAQRSGEGVSAREPINVLGLDDAADNGRGWGRNSEALALRRRGEERGDAGRLVAK